MPDSLLQTKLYAPPLRPNLVLRPRLIDWLNQGLQLGHRLTLVSAPAGFGKTTLTSDWVTGLRRPVAWLSLDEGDSDHTRFLAYLIAALQTVETSIGSGALAVLKTSQSPPTEAILTSLLNDIAVVQNSFVLVLDDYHLINANLVDRALAFLIEHQPTQMHLVIATRTDPDLPLARLRARSQLTEVRASDLRFTFSEAADFLNRMMSLDLSVENIVTLETRTEGWIAGLQLAALAMHGQISVQGNEDAASFINSFTGSHHYVLDYLIEEVLEQQSESIQNFLLQTAVLDRMTGSLCDALTGEEDGQETLEALERANLFVTPLDAERRWYRYHHLFSDLLRRRLRQKQPDRQLGLHHLAGEWYEQNGFADEAIKHALRSQHFEWAADLIENVAESVWFRSEHAKLGHWLEKLPTELVLSRTRLCILRAGYLFASGQQDSAELSLQAAEQLLDADTGPTANSSQLTQHQLPGTDEMQLQGRIAATRSFMASYRSDAPETISYAHQALECLPEEDIIWRVATTVALGDAYIYNGEYVAAHRTYLEALETINAVENSYLFMDVSLKQALNLRAQGRLQQVIEICREQVQFANESGLAQTETAGWLLAIWGEVLAEVDDLEGAIHQARKGVELTERGANVAMLGWSYLCLTRVLFSRGDMTGAQEIIHKAAIIARDNVVPDWITKQMAAWQVRVWLAQSQQSTASQWVQERGLDLEGEPTYVGALETIALARVLIAEERCDEAIELLQRQLERAEAGGHTTRVVEILILQALAFQAGADTIEAVAALQQALTLAEPGGFIRIFVDEGSKMARLLYKAQDRGIKPEYIRRLLITFSNAEAKKTSLLKAQAPKSKLIEPLSERELEVLQRIAEGLTNREIANRLFLSPNTVKVHTRNIYGKLGAHNRTQAVARARAEGILPSS